jgi:hypothetical protein
MNTLYVNVRRGVGVTSHCLATLALVRCNIAGCSLSGLCSLSGDRVYAPKTVH